MLDKSYKILRIIKENPLNENELLSLCRNSYITPSLMLRKQWITYSNLSENGEPLQPYVITDIGLEYLLNKTQQDKAFWRAFFSNFISGFIVGILVTVLGTYLKFKLGL